LNDFYNQEIQHFKKKEHNMGPICHSPPSERTGPKREDEESHELGAGFVGGPITTLQMSRHPRKLVLGKQCLAALLCVKYTHIGLAPNVRQKESRELGAGHDQPMDKLDELSHLEKNKHERNPNLKGGKFHLPRSKKKKKKKKKRQSQHRESQPKQGISEWESCSYILV
jgi:hypothetical protein